MKSPWTPTLAWLAAVAAVLGMAWITPDEDSIERELTLHTDMPLRAAAAQ